uniref:guanylate cyclase n=1 Tax=Chelydra serpentina TaxID=8475 RepID=A0A8C3SI22_CHESE
MGKRHNCFPKGVIISFDLTSPLRALFPCSIIIEKFGEETWEKLRTQAEVQDTFMTYTVYDDVITLKLIQEACKILNVSEDVVLKLLGEYFFTFCKMSGYDRMLQTLGGNLTEFIENLDALHSYLALSYQEMNAPSFRVEKRTDGTMLLHYYSDRRGLCHIVPGIIESVARDFFNSEVTMEILTQNEEKERTGKKEHVIFLVLQKAKRPKRKTKKTTNPESGDSHKDKEVQELWVEERTFCNAFPFHIVFDEELRIKQAGVNIQKFVPGLRQPGSRVDKYFTVVHPQVTFTIFSIRTFINSQFVLRAHREMLPDSWRNQPMLKLRGQMIWMESIQCMMYLCSPKLRSLEELEEQKMHISDIAQHDTTRDLILLNQQRLAEIELSNQLERKKEELRILSKNLEAEKKKTETLLYAMLPKHVANLLKEGKKVEAGEFNSCTILFSDIVTFTNICSACEPIQIVNMLNSMYSKFDRLTSVHNVYKVETIGDAYMVVGGVPVPIASHAKRVANFALGMRTAAREVMNPVTGEPIQIRVGIHTGPVLAGVVGEKMPRYCLFGDTVNTASRMESHGLPNKIHLSPTAFRALQNQSFEIVERGEIEVKGKGKMTTYILRQNLYATENEIMGRAEKSPKKKTSKNAIIYIIMAKYRVCVCVCVCVCVWLLMRTSDFRFLPLGSEIIG